MTTENPAEFQMTLEQPVLAAASKFLETPEARTVKSPEWMESTVDQTVVKAATENTLFHIEKSYVAGSANADAKKTIVSWLTLGEDKGDLPSGSLEILEDGGETKIFAYKLDDPLITDEGYKNGISVDVVDRTSDMKTSGRQVELTNEQIQTVLARLASAQVDNDSTETTARALDATNRLSEAIVNFQQVENSGAVARYLKKGEALGMLKKAMKASEEFWPPPEEYTNVKKKKEESDKESQSN